MNVSSKRNDGSVTLFTFLIGSGLIVLCSTVKAQTHSLWGQIYANHLSLPNVKVEAGRSGQTTLADEHGKFKLSVRSQDTLYLKHPDFPTRYYLLPKLDTVSQIQFYFDMVTDTGDWRPYQEEQRNSVDPPASEVDTSLIPRFPWPIPPPSAKAVLNRQFFSKDTTLAQVDQRLSAALRKSGYPDPGYYQIPHGFAMVGQVEQIERNGKPKQPPVRWSSSVDVQFSQFALSNYLQHLYRAATGYFRVIVFLVTDVPTVKKQAPVGAETARAWYDQGADFLPNVIGKQLFTSDHQVTAQIYEFEKPENHKARLLNPGNCTGSEHLSQSKIINSLAR